MHLYIAFHRFGQAKFAYGGSVLGSSQFTLLLQLPLKMTLDLKVVAIFHNLPWLSKTKVIYKKSQRSAVNACGNRMCKRGLNSRQKKFGRLGF